MLSANRVSAIEGSAWFQSKWAPYLLCDADWRIRAVNAACERVSGHPRENLLGRQLFDAFPDNPADPEADGVANVSASLEFVLRRGVRHWLGVQRYDIPDPQVPGEFVYKVWTPMNSPIKDGKKTIAVLQHAQDVTRVVPPTPAERAYPKLFELRRAAEVLARQFPDLPSEAVLSVLTHSHSMIAESAGTEDLERAEALAKLRLETHAGHPAKEP
ncbi:PAS domain-containing protein [Mycobacterium europaeum]|uniref:PAS domain-containing protein n=1 Tax=Mycobacterium europaeum TaxID=761804 RepID=UPI002AE0AD06|nr:PAS domain-containing protein [Mycobacterium europaeum]MEA1162014.1 PAS domain-containing protein [Mycobacterium europaeum]